MADLVLQTVPLGSQWPTIDPFLFCAHHDDAYPTANDRMGPDASLEGREIGQDFAQKDGWNMYHGSVVPGFPPHPHRGFETVTFVRKGYIDHADSLGAAARFGRGDVQWLTAGRGVVHSEMFPLLDQDADNPLELFQIWLNLPGEDKMVPPHFAMLWNEAIPRAAFTDEAGRATEITLVAGQLADARAPLPPPKSWAARPDTDVAIWCLKLAPGARFSLPAATHPKTVRALYFFRGPSLRVAGETIESHAAVRVRSGVDVPLEAGDGECEILVLQGRPIGETVVQHGPFVMNTRA
ncbi:MAG: Pirin family protein, partial [Actinomycetia bacterium]|nr:Pirin family protein [Actinomycetes bacterium]